MKREFTFGILFLLGMSVSQAADPLKTPFAPKVSKPLVTEITAPTRPSKGLQDRHIALWQSHGLYFENSLQRWEWQRCRIFQTVEDKYTQSYVLPFLVPMLENAGARVLLPRERDVNSAETIVDNDFGLSTQSLYTESQGFQKWTDGTEPGFAHLRNVYTDRQNPFSEGTYRQVATVPMKKNPKKQLKVSEASWIPSIQADGHYAVYVSYHTLPNSADDALYTVYHQGGVSRFKVNQTMGGGTWIYLGTFDFAKGISEHQKITLSNLSDKADRVVTADAVRIGGGEGNIGRPETSGYPRYLEGSRYWLQWAGMPDSVYTESGGKNDYTDDYKSRALWVNYLAGGSEVNPRAKGLNIPIDLALAFHTDAGTTLNDSIIGTLGIYMTNTDEGVYANGASRRLAATLTDYVQNSIVHDIRALYEPKWSHRGSRDASYYEARVPKVPAMLLEMLSHQNFADMRYGLDPRFRFSVSRAIYKGLLRFISEQRHQKYVVQPLPVSHFSASLDNHQAVLSWQAVADSLEPTALPDKYLVYTRVGNSSFDNGTVVTSNSYRVDIPAGVVCSFKIVAVNEGGKSFPSEILSVGRSIGSTPKALVVNGFDRLSAPDDFVAPAPADTLLAGFLDQEDHGVPYLYEINYTGSMKSFTRSIPWMDDDSGGFGDSDANFEKMVIAGNTFDYPAVHGEAILKAGYSFESCSREAFVLPPKGSVALVDLILGKQKQTKMGRGGVTPLAFKTFTPALQKVLTDYCGQGGNVLVSGSYVGTDLWCNPLATPDTLDQRFATRVLQYKWRNSRASVSGEVKAVRSPFSFEGDYHYFHELNPQSYVVESPDAIEPASSEAHTVLRYAENNKSAAVAYKGSYSTFVMGFPFEALNTAAQREQLMRQVIRFF